jgi:hypothetical protein
VNAGGRAAAAALAALLFLGADGRSAAAVPAPGVALDTTPPPSVLDVPFVPQSEALCGGASVAMVLRYWGDDSVDARSFAPLVDDSARGIRAKVLTDQVRSLGWRAVAFRGSLGELGRQIGRGRPVIVLLRVSPERYHYVVVVAVDRESVLVHDPARAPFRRLSARDFLRMWAPSGAWSLLVVPPDRPVERPRAAPLAGATSEDSASLATVATPADSAAGTGSVPASCHERVGQAVRLAAEGNLAEAASRLERTAAACPDSASPLRELSGVRFRQRRWSEAEDAARRALTLAPGDAYTTRLLASELYMAGKRSEALRSWNEVGEPRLAALRVYGLERVRYGVVSRRVRFPVDGVITPDRLALARRRLGAVPAFARVRVGWNAQGAGKADLQVAVLERRLFRGGLPGIVLGLAAGIPERAVRLETGSLVGAGETWAAAWRWWEERPRISLQLRTPDAAGLAGIWDVVGFWERQAFRATSGLAAPATLHEERWHGGLGMAAWATPELRWRAGLSLDRWVGRGTGAGAEAGVEVRIAGDRIRLAAVGRGWPGPGGSFGTVDGEADWRSSARPEGIVTSVRTGLGAASARAPLGLWPGAGIGHARPTLLRAHPLLDGGVVSGAVFGRRVAYAGAEVTGWLGGPGPLATGGALFVDAARAWRRPAGGASPVEVDVGAGLRLALPGSAARLRLDVAHGLRDGRNAVSIGWEGPWVGVEGEP